MEKAAKEKILYELGGISEADYDSLIKELIGQVDKQIKEMKKAMEGGDFAVIAKIAHSVKGSSGNLRIPNMAEIAKVMESEAQGDRDKNVLFEELKKLEHELAVLKAGENGL